MPTIITHAVAAGALATGLTRSRCQPALFWILCAGLAVLPDADVVAFALRVPYDSMWAHRGLSHSLPLAAATAALVAALARHRLPMRGPVLWPCLTVAMVSHGVLDAFTNGGPGVAFVAPFDTTRFFAPWRPVMVSPIGLHFFSPWGLRTLVSELAWIWLPSLLLTAAARARG